MKVILKYNGYLDDITKAYCLTIPRYAERARQTTNMEVVEEKIRDFSNAWNKIGDKVMSAIEAITHLPFPESIVRVHFVKIIHRTYADTMIFPYNTTVDEFLTYFIHELCHLSGYKTTESFEIEFEKETSAVRQHIIIHAMLEKVFSETLDKPDYISQEKKRAQKHTSTTINIKKPSLINKLIGRVKNIPPQSSLPILNTYTRAWEIVEKVGYKKILQNYVLTYENK